MDLGVWMSAEVLEDKLECACDGMNPEVTWNTRRLPKKLQAGWSNRLFVASSGRWMGYFPLAGEVLWNPADERAPLALIFNARRWTRIASVPVKQFRGWRYVDTAALGVGADTPTTSIDRP